MLINKYSPKLVILWGILFLLAIFILSTELSATDSSEINNINLEIKRYNTLVNKRTQELEKIKNQKNQYYSDIKNIDNKLKITNEELNLVLLKREILEQEIKNLEDELQIHKTALKKIIAKLYLIGNKSFIKFFLENQNNNHLLTYYQLIVQQKNKELLRIADINTQLQEKKSNIESNITTLQSSTEQYQRDIDEIKKQSAIKEKEEKEIKNKLANEQKLLKDFQDSIATLNKELKDNEKKTPSLKYKGLKYCKGNIPWPHKGSILIKFGQKRNPQLTWKGILISGSLNDPIHAIADGKILYSGWLAGIGNIIVIDHGMNYLSIYGNNDKNIIRNGDSVSKGEVIAYIGRTGIFKTNSLYFEIRHNGNPINPILFLTK